MGEVRKREVQDWVKNEVSDKHIRTALENASCYFDGNNPFTVHTLEAVYARESSFGRKMGANKRGSNGPAGHFQFDKPTGIQYGLKITKDNDERFDIDQSSAAAAKYLKALYGYFTRGQDLRPAKKIISAVPDIGERKKFTFAAYNAGPGTIAVSQMEAEKAGSDVTLWDKVKEFLGLANVDAKKEQEIKDYVPIVDQYEELFDQLSPADKNKKKLSPKKDSEDNGEGCHWVTLDHGPVCIDD